MTIETIYQRFLKHPVVCTDTRKIAEGCFFIALKGANFNGNSFAQKALEMGAACVLVDEVEYYQNIEQYILVDDCLQTLQDLASYHRMQLNIPVIAIVGSNGKTTTKELLYSVLSEQFQVHTTPGNFNNHIGLPLTLLMLQKSHEIAVIEMGANHVGENLILCEIAKPNLGLVTNNGKDHLEGFGDIEGVKKSNKELYDYLAMHNGLAFVNNKDESLVEMAVELKQVKTYAANYTNSVHTAQYEFFANYLQPTIQFQLAENILVESVLSGSYNFDNIVAAAAVGQYFKMGNEAIARGINKYKPSNLRSQLIIKTKNKIFLDAYNANPSSMELSIQNFMAMDGKDKLLILGDMFELGSFEAQEHQAIVELCSTIGLTEKQVWLVGKAFANTNCKYAKFLETADCRAALIEQNLDGKFFFLKGSRGMKLESLVEVIQ
jgi:UDP-N-acetylmuramoyl-tripeptide--D-alanyl-D-alanine ligase